MRQRRRDIAVHVAMGATPANVIRLVLQREMRLVAVGLAAGLVLALGETGLIGYLSMPVPALGIAGLAGISAVMLLVALAATMVPAFGALRIAPMQVLRQE